MAARSEEKIGGDRGKVCIDTSEHRFEMIDVV